MDINQIEKFCDEKSKDIAKKISSEYDQNDFDVDRLAIEKEIFEASSGYAAVFVFEKRFLVPSEDEENLKSTTTSRFGTSSRAVDKMSLKDLIAHLIKSYSINHLNEFYDLILI